MFSAMEARTSYKPWHDKSTGKTFLSYDSGNACITTFTSSTKYLDSATTVQSAILLQRPQLPTWHHQEEDKTYKYYLTRMGKVVIATGLIVKEISIIPLLATA